MPVHALAALTLAALATSCAPDTGPPGQFLDHGFWSSDAEPCPLEGPANATLVRSPNDIDAWFAAYTCEDDETEAWVDAIGSEVRGQYASELDDDEHLVLISQPYATATVREVTLDGAILYVSLDPDPATEGERTFMKVTVFGDVGAAEETVVHWDNSETSPVLQLVGGVGALLWLLGLG